MRFFMQSAQQNIWRTVGSINGAIVTQHRDPRAGVTLETGDWVSN